MEHATAKSSANIITAISVIFFIFLPSEKLIRTTIEKIEFLSLKSRKTLKLAKL